MTTRDDPFGPVTSVVRSYPSSIVVRRWIGAWVDFVVLFGWLVAGEVALGSELYQRTIWVWIAGIALYFPLTEGLRGWSLGKLVTGTRVVRADGSLPGLGKAAIRTALRLVEVNPLLAGGLPAGIAVFASEYRQRLGDMAAKTYVLRKSDVDELRAPAEAPHQVWGPLARG